MTFGSTFTGIGGFDLGFERAGLTPLWQVENDRDARRVLRRHWSHIVCQGDVKECGVHNLGTPDVICGGWPCQDVSQAGQRKGLAGERSGLFFEFARIVGELQPELVVFENVPGLLSSNSGRDALMVLRVFADLDFHGGWRVLDSQYFGVAQRRDRVFGVFARGRAGARRAAEILALTESRQGHPSPRGQEKQGTAATLRGRSHSAGVSAPGRGGEDDQNLIAAAVTAGYAKGFGNNDGKKGSPRNLIVSDTLTGRSVGNTGGSNGPPTGLICHTLNGKNGKRYDGESETFVVFDEQNFERHADARQTNFGSKDFGSVTTTANRRLIGNSQLVRRLMPVECLRLQGFTDDWLDLDPPLSDSAKYRLIGNAVTVPVAEWLGRRLLATNSPPAGVQSPP